MLTLVSDTLDTMLSERWNSTNELIKIENFTFDEFYQFITFLYSEECHLSTDNIYSMIDIAEFYNVQCFKEYCEKHILKMDINMGNINQMFHTAKTYSLLKFKNKVRHFMTTNFRNISISDDFLKFGKSTVEELIVVNKYKIKPEELFQAASFFLYW